jgi:hypothetical protein
MLSFLNKLFGWLHALKPRITCDSAVWTAGVGELEKRTLNGRRESGAFLLGHENGGRRHIVEFVYYDDIDPHSLDTGIVKFAGNKLPKLWEHCRKRGCGVVADVHVHPGGYGQSASDQADPVIRAQATSPSSFLTLLVATLSPEASASTNISVMTTGRITPRKVQNSFD